MIKKWLVIFYLCVIAFAVLPKTYFHDCHYQHETSVEKQHSNFEKVCQVCDLYFLQIFDITDVGFIFTTYLTTEIPTFLDVTLFVTSTIQSVQSRGPPSGI